MIIRYEDTARTQDYTARTRILNLLHQVPGHKTRFSSPFIPQYLFHFFLIIQKIDISHITTLIVFIFMLDRTMYTLRIHRFTYQWFLILKSFDAHFTWQRHFSISKLFVFFILFSTNKHLEFLKETTLSIMVCMRWQL